MGDSMRQSTMDNEHEYSIVVVNMGSQPGRAVNALASSLFKRLRNTAGDDPSMSVSIDDISSDQDESASWAITAESSSKTTRYLLHEFYPAPSEGPRFVDYFVWIARGPVRAVKYLRYRFHESVGTGPRWQRTMALVSMLPKTFMITAWVFSYCYILLFISFVAVQPLRRWRLWMTVLYLVAIALLVSGLTWGFFLPSLVTATSLFTQELVVLVNHPELSFALLFPVVAAVIIAVAISTLTFLIGWMRRATPKVDAWMFPTRGAADFAYLLDPLYAATAGRAFEKSFLEAADKKETHPVFVVCEHGGILMGYEVLSRVCTGKIGRPVHLMTRNLALAGLPVGSSTSFWLLVEPTEWPRFAKLTPCGLMWHYYAPQLLSSNEFSLKMDSTPLGRVPQVRCERIGRSRFRSTYSMLVDRLIALANQS